MHSWCTRTVPYSAPLPRFDSCVSDFLQSWRGDKTDSSVSRKDKWCRSTSTQNHLPRLEVIMVAPFEQLVGAAGDLRELEYISVLMQTGVNVRQDCSIRGGYFLYAYLVSFSCFD